MAYDALKINSNLYINPSFFVLLEMHTDGTATYHTRYGGATEITDTALATQYAVALREFGTELETVIFNHKAYFDAKIVSTNLALIGYGDEYRTEIQLTNPLDVTALGAWLIAHSETAVIIVV